jgi:VanZ family protein
VRGFVVGVFRPKAVVATTCRGRRIDTFMPGAVDETARMKLRLPLLPAWLRWAFVACVAGFIFYTSILTSPPTYVDPARPELVPLDKWRHFLAYAAFGGALAYASVDWSLGRRAAIVFVLGVTVAYGVGIEAWQATVPDRYLSVGDAYANALGAVLVAPWYLVRPYLNFEPIREWVNDVRATWLGR